MLLACCMCRAGSLQLATAIRCIRLYYEVARRYLQLALHVSLCWCLVAALFMPYPPTAHVQGRICAAGYRHPMHPSQYSHVLYAVQLSPTCIRWSYMPADQAWKMPSTAPARFDKSVATVRRGLGLLNYIFELACCRAQLSEA
jgi:hypothetical protein